MEQNERLKTQKQEKFMIKLFLNRRVDIEFFEQSYFVWNELRTTKDCGLFIEKFLNVLKNLDNKKHFEKYIMNLMIKKQIKESEIETQKLSIEQLNKDISNNLNIAKNIK